MTKAPLFDNANHPDSSNKSFPAKVKEVFLLWQKLLGKPEASDLDNFKTLTSELKQHAKTYEYNELARYFSHLENSLLHLDLPITQKDRSAIQHLLDTIQAANKIFSDDIDKLISASYSKELANSTIYFITEDYNWADNFKSQLSNFGYRAEIILNTDKLSQNEINNPLILIINIATFTERLSHFIQNLKLKYKHLPVYYIAESGAFDSRLQALRSGADVYFIKPITIDDLVSQLDEAIFLTSETYRILIVEDDLVIAKFYSAVLHQSGMIAKVISKPNQIEAVLAEFKPHLLLLDIYMPECNGMELATIIRQQKAYASIPIVFLSSEEDKLKQLSAMHLGADDFITKSTQTEYLLLAIKNRIDRYQTLVSMMIKDSLTRVYNHTTILQKVGEIVVTSALAKQSCAIAMLDLDFFKKVNDTYGHLAGDYVLKSLCLLMRKQLRSNDIVGRYGGEEFLIVMPDIDAENAKKILIKLKDHFSQLPFEWKDQRFFVTFSAGVASYPNYINAADLIHAADKALYKAKDAGRNTIVIQYNDTII